MNLDILLFLMISIASISKFNIIFARVAIDELAKRYKDVDKNVVENKRNSRSKEHVW